MADKTAIVAGIDVGAECVKVVVTNPDLQLLGHSVVPTRGYFQERVQEATTAALDEAQTAQSDLAEICVTGFGKECVPFATMTSGEMMCHALAAYRYFPEAMSVVDIGGRDPRVIQVEKDGRPTDIYTLRRCAVGIGTFLTFASRHLDVHPTRLQELAAASDTPAPVGSYCSVFAGNDVLDRLREGATREMVALGCMHSVAERIVEIGGFADPLRITGGVVEYFPGVIQALARITRMRAEAIPQPILAGALGAAILALRKMGINTRASVDG